MAGRKVATKSPRKFKKSEKRAVPGQRPMWTGQLRLSLVSVPVRLYPAVKSGARLAFHQVHAPSGKRVRYEKVVPGIGPIDTSDIIKGYEVSKGRYVLLTDEEIDTARVEARETCELVQFVDYVVTKHGMSELLDSLVGGTSQLYADSVTPITDAVNLLIDRATEAGEIRLTMDPLDLLRALAGGASISCGPAWRQAARQLIDILIAGMRAGR